VPADWIKYKQAEYHLQEKEIKKRIKHAEKNARKPGFELVNFECPRCQGEKHCADCSGTGELARSGLRGLMQSTMKCPFCNGSGKCRLCEGAGSFQAARARVV
jgi:DnaJ-class molecular chaperone